MSRPLEMLSEKKKGETKGALFFFAHSLVQGFSGARIICRKRLKHLLQRYILSSVAVLLVILATYILFDAGSIVLLSLLQRTNVSFINQRILFRFLI